MDKINEYLKRTRDVYTYPDGLYVERPRKPIVCVDGFTISVQAGFGMYSIPRINGADEYTKVELGFPSEADELIMDYAEDPDDPTETVYGYVPIEIVNELIEKHGGIVE